MSAPLVPGTTVDRYRVEAIIGAGSMGDVFRGVDNDLHRRVAIKILSEKHRDNEELRARFVREARAVAAISHPNVVQVFTTGTFDDRPFIAMEFLDGVDLGSCIEHNGPLSSLEAARAVLDAARGLDAAAKAGLIHRDVKPSNLVLLGDGTVKVTDFGLAKPVDPGNEPALTAMGVVVGTPDYIAPEQARGDPIDERVDIYALGGTLYFLITGVPPFRTGKPAEDKYLKVVARHLRMPAPDARARVASVDKELAQLARTMMAKKPVDRPDYAELTERLVAIVERLALAAGEPLPRTRSVPPGSGGHVAPTPFVGGREPTSFDSGATHDFDPSQHPDLDDSAPTNLRIPSTPPGRMQAPDAPATPRARWLIITTVVSALVFTTGLGLLLFGPIPVAQPQPLAIDAAAPPPIDAAPQPPPIPDTPEGMLRVDRADGTPWFFISAAPVTRGDYAEVFPPDRKLSRYASRLAATNVPFKYARDYATARGMRLPTPEEWQAAHGLEGFQTARGRTWEWVDDGTTGISAPRPVVRGEEIDSRKPNAYRDVTFRVAADIETIAAMPREPADAAP